MGLSLDKVCEIVDSRHEPLPLAGVRVGSRTGGLVGGFILHGTVALSQRDPISGTGLDFLLSLLMEKSQEKAIPQCIIYAIHIIYAIIDYSEHSNPGPDPLDVSQSRQPF